MVLARRGIQTEAISQLEPLQEVVVHLELAIEALALVFVEVILKNVVGIHHAVRGVIVTRRVERIAEVLQTGDTDVARSLHQRVVHILNALTGRHEVVLLEGIVH